MKITKLNWPAQEAKPIKITHGGAEIVIFVNEGHDLVINIGEDQTYKIEPELNGIKITLESES